MSSPFLFAQFSVSYRYDIDCYLVLYIPWRLGVKLKVKGLLTKRQNSNLDGNRILISTFADDRLSSKYKVFDQVIR